MTQVSERLTDKIKIAILQLQNLQMTHEKVSAEHNALIEMARAEVGAPPEHVFDMPSQTFKSPNGPKPLSTEQRRQRKRVA